MIRSGHKNGKALEKLSPARDFTGFPYAFQWLHRFMNHPFGKSLPEPASIHHAQVLAFFPPSFGIRSKAHCSISPSSDVSLTRKSAPAPPD